MRIVLHRIAVTNPSIDKTTPNSQAGVSFGTKAAVIEHLQQTPSWRRGI
ncbi:hypothetical protein GGE16_000668 [Rhizobium leguminosarum]|uniref:Uncharacterized protein n=1 Tax=Rhizobium leguminosarum TaxID=384 RepID=A0AAE2MGF0_RHILE|nr:hypothetical protein [Rhizobium leguminosarum]MBB4432616.1 hypothetical protein [Rhizobium esperanzae]MBB4295255.1 hypothetical protein [Rhizobium leguminosarum]MBB4306648.1 hypothetical protein [Rhizobium leguminosarum]MBB4417770.1 hypothetical protein [Rhizobium leguminosarum]